MKKESALTNYLDKVLNPAVFKVLNKIKIINEDFDFQDRGGHWESHNYLNGERHPTDSNKTVSYERYYNIQEEGGSRVTYANYVSNKLHCSVFEAADILAKAAGVEPFADSNNLQYRRLIERRRALHLCNNYFLTAMEKVLDGSNTSKQSKQLFEYLTEGRGYSVDEIKLMGLGYFDNETALETYLSENGLGKQGAKEFTKRNMSIKKGIGSKNVISIPEFIGDDLTGFTFRRIANDGEYKTLNLTNERADGTVIKSRQEFLYIPLGVPEVTEGNISNDALAIVEGQLDALRARARGIPNVVCLGGSTVRIEQVRSAQERGFREFILFLDLDKGKMLDEKGNPTTKQEVTAKRIETIIDTFRSNKIYTLKIGFYPDTDPDNDNGKTDLDTLLGDTDGVEKFDDACLDTLDYTEYITDRVLDKHPDAKTASDVETEKIVYDFVEEVLKESREHRKIFEQGIYCRLEEFRLAEILQITPDRLAEFVKEKELKEQEKENEKAAQEYSKKALEVLQTAEMEINKGVDGEAAFKDAIKKFSNLSVEKNASYYRQLLLTPISLYDFIQECKEEGEALDTGYRLKTKGGRATKLTLPSAGLSIFVANTSHCKTTILLNMAINIAEDNRRAGNDKKVYFFGYEENTSKIVRKAFNIFVNLTLNNPVEDVDNIHYSENNKQAIDYYFKHSKNYGDNRDNDEAFKLFPAVYRKQGKERDEFLERQRQFFEDFLGKYIVIRYLTEDVDSLMKAMKFAKEYGDGAAIFVDYIQLLHLMKGDKLNGDNRQTQLKSICVDYLNPTAQELKIPVVLGAQFNREVGSHKAITETSVGEAGDIERIATLLVGMWNNQKPPRGYFTGREGDEDREQVSKNDVLSEVTKRGIYVTDPPTLYLKILKNRDGASQIEGLINMDLNRSKLYKGGKEDGDATDKDKQVREIKPQESKEQKQK